jgi:enolase
MFLATQAAKCPQICSITEKTQATATAANPPMKIALSHRKSNVQKTGSCTNMLAHIASGAGKMRDKTKTRTRSTQYCAPLPCIHTH